MGLADVFYRSVGARRRCAAWPAIVSTAVASGVAAVLAMHLAASWHAAVIASTVPTAFASVDLRVLL